MRMSLIIAFVCFLESVDPILDRISIFGLIPFLHLNVSFVKWCTGWMHLVVDLLQLSSPQLPLFLLWSSMTSARYLAVSYHLSQVNQVVWATHAYVRDHSFLITVDQQYALCLLCYRRECMSYMVKDESSLTCTRLLYVDSRISVGVCVRCAVKLLWCISWTRQFTVWFMQWL